MTVIPYCNPNRGFTKPASNDPYQSNVWTSSDEDYAKWMRLYSPARRAMREAEALMDAFVRTSPHQEDKK